MECQYSSGKSSHCSAGHQGLLFDAASSAERFRNRRIAYCSCRYPNAYVVMPPGAIHRLVSSGESVVLLIVRP